MSAFTPIVALVLYPLISNLPLNLVRFRWSFAHGLTPMPPGEKLRAEAADRAVLLIIYIALLILVGSLFNHSSVSPSDIGLTALNWKSAMAFGALFSYVPLSLVIIVRRMLPPDTIYGEQESRGPLASWCGLAVIGSISIEFWRVFCVALLMRLEYSAWSAVLIVAAAFGASQLTTSNAKAAGAVFFGGIAGFLFVRTDSLLAPLTMSLIVWGVRIYRSRHAPPRTRQSYSYFNVTCPMCGVGFDRRDVKDFICPGCGEELTFETETKFNYIWFAVCVFGFPILLYHLGIRNLFALICGPILLWFVGMIINSSFFPQQVIQKYGGLELKDRTKSQEKHPPTDD